MNTTQSFGLLSAAATLGILSSMCGTPAPDPTGYGGSSSTGGAVTPTGGTPATGGSETSTGGTATGGSSTGGTATGGSSTGGTATGGSSTGGTDGGSATGGTAGGASGGGGAGGGAGVSLGGASGTAGASAGAGGGGEAGKAGGGATGTGGAQSGGDGGKSGGTGGGATATFADVAKIFDAKCSSCHDGTKSDRIVLKNDAGLYGRLTTPIAAPVTDCVDQLLVDKATPANSLIGKIIQGPVNIAGTGAKACDIPQMPPAGKGTLSAGDKSTILSWINAGAPQ